MPNGTLHYLQGVPCFRNKFCKAHFCATIVTRKEKHCQNCFSWSKMMMMIVNIGKAMLKKEHNNGFMCSAMGIQKLFWNLTSDLSISSTIWSSLFIIFDSLKIQCWNHFVVSFRTTLQHVYCLVIRAERGFVVHFQNVKVQFCKSQNKKSCKHRYYKASNLYQILKSFLCGR